MGKLVLYASMSLDGYVSTKDGRTDWQQSHDEFDDAYVFNTFFETVGAVVMDYPTYLKAHALPEWPYGDKPAYVIIDHEPEGGHPHVDFVVGSADGFIEWLKGEIAGDIWLVPGNHAIAEFNTIGAIDVHWLSIYPLILGNGVPLFEPGLLRANLQVVETRAYDNGMLQLIYQVLPRE